MKKLMAFVLMLVCVLGLAGCSGRTATVWNWAKNVKQEDINAVTPWSDGNTLEPLDDNGPIISDHSSKNIVNMVKYSKKVKRRRHHDTKNIHAGVQGQAGH